MQELHFISIVNLKVFMGSIKTKIQGKKNTFSIFYSYLT